MMMMILGKQVFPPAMVCSIAVSKDRIGIADCAVKTGD